MFFPATYQNCAEHLREDAPKLIAMEVTVPDLSTGPRGPVVISLPTTRCTPPVVERLKEVLATHPGTTDVHLQLVSPTRTTVLRLDDRLRVSPSPSFMGDVKVLLGAG